MFLQHQAHQLPGDRAFVANFSAPADEAPEPEDDDNDSLADVVRDEQEYLRGRLREELKREPTEQEMNDWLRQHTEGY